MDEITIALTQRINVPLKLTTKKHMIFICPYKLPNGHKKFCHKIYLQNSLNIFSLQKTKRCI